jgi:hypothetical protein
MTATGRFTSARAATAFALTSLFAAAVSGCSRDEELRVAITPVSGKVLFNGQPPAGAQVLLHPQGHALPEGAAAAATVQADGSFQPRIYGDEPGVPPGNYVVTLQWFKVVEGDGGAGRGPNVLPREYAQAQTSPVKVTVKDDGPTAIGPIEIRQ